MATNNKTTVAEAEILSSFLLSRAALRDIITPRGFADLFPKDKRSNPQVRILYRELQQARTRQCDRVQRSIQQEARQGAMYRKQAAEKRKKDESLDEDVMLGIELFGATAIQPVLPLKELLVQMERAAEDLEAEQASIDDECDEILGELRTIVGDFSDLRYGKFATPSTVEQVTREINHLVEVCGHTLDPDGESTQ